MFLLRFLCIPLNGWAGSIDSNDTTDLLLGGVGVLLGHELGHLVLSQTKDIEFDGVAIVYSQSVLTPQEKLRVASAGFQVQWLLSELPLINCKSRVRVAHVIWPLGPYLDILRSQRLTSLFLKTLPTVMSRRWPRQQDILVII